VGSTFTLEHWLISTKCLFTSYYGKPWFLQNVLVSSKWTQHIRFFNEFHYILSNHLNLLKYSYIVVPPLNEFCECIFSCGLLWKKISQWCMDMLFKPFVCIDTPPNVYFVIVHTSNVIHKMFLYLVQGFLPFFVGTLHLWTHFLFFDLRGWPRFGMGWVVLKNFNWTICLRSFFKCFKWK
jgi:hypothetical protein